MILDGRPCLGDGGDGVLDEAYVGVGHVVDYEKQDEAYENAGHELMDQKLFLQMLDVLSIGCYGLVVGFEGLGDQLPVGASLWREGVRGWDCHITHFVQAAAYEGYHGNDGIQRGVVGGIGENGGHGAHGNAGRVGNLFVGQPGGAAVFLQFFGVHGWIPPRMHQISCGIAIHGRLISGAGRILRAETVCFYCNGREDMVKQNCKLTESLYHRRTVKTRDLTEKRRKNHEKQRRKNDVDPEDRPGGQTRKRNHAEAGIHSTVQTNGISGGIK